ncbi:MAG: hypothetical protein ACLT76_11895 [Clostridium fessum]
MQTEEKRENIEEKKEERMEMPVSGALNGNQESLGIRGRDFRAGQIQKTHTKPEDVYDSCNREFL